MRIKKGYKIFENYDGALLAISNEIFKCRRHARRELKRFFIYKKKPFENKPLRLCILKVYYISN